jgi:hypothetical protein
MAAGLGLLGAISAVCWWSLGGAGHQDLGFVSERWLAEHRHAQSHHERS